MTEQELAKILKPLRAIKPDQKFIKRSRALILAADSANPEYQSQMEKYLYGILRPLKNILKPHPEFIRQSRPIILTYTKTGAFKILRILGDSIKFAAALSLASLLLLLVLGGMSYFKTNFSPVILTGFNTQKLLGEIDDLDFQIRLTEAQYYSQSTKEVAAAPDEVSQNDESVNKDVDKLLDEIIL